MKRLVRFVPEDLLKLAGPCHSTARSIGLKRTFRRVDHLLVGLTAREDHVSTRTAARPQTGPSAAAARLFDRARPHAAPAATAPAAPRGGAQAWLLRGGIAFAFAYAAVAMLVDHGIFLRYAPAALRSPGPARLALPAFAAYELLLAAALAVGRRVFLASVLAMVTIAAIVVLNLDAFGILFRNVTIACACASLALQSRGQRR